MQTLGANLRIDSEEFKPFLSIHGLGKVHIIPDASHMVKLVRNTLDRVKCIYNVDNKVNCKYVSYLVRLPATSCNYFNTLENQLGVCKNAC